MRQMIVYAIDEIDGGEPGRSVLLVAGGPGRDGVILCGAVSPRVRAEVDAAGCAVTVVSGLSARANACAALRGIYGFLRQARPDIVHAHGFRAGLLARFAVIAWKYFGGGRRVKLVYTPHGALGRVGARRAAETFADRVLAHFSDALVALSRAEKNENLRAGIGCAGQWVVIPPGIKENFAQEFADYEKFEANRAGVRKELAVPADAVVLLYCGKLVAGRGLDTLVTALAVVKKRVGGMCGQGELDPEFKVRLVMAGEGPDERALELLAERHGVADWIVFAGWRNDAAGLMSACDALVQPSRGEPAARAVIEAQAAGLAVICADAGGLTEYVEPERTALIAQAGSAESLAGALLSIIIDPGLRANLGMAGREWMAEPDTNGFTRFSENAFMLRHQQLYDFVRGQ
ncbi:MAG: glycosyltransferase family 4 protein [Elusimicrobiaceae bacterium]|nr:glycosyltransferase family 4 protein [Elusimicrobiaceae bacterium]